MRHILGRTAEMPRLCIAAASSGAGKTSFTLGLLRLLSRRSLVLCPFKAGPDYIDPGQHALACNVPSYNLDSRLMSKKTILSLFTAHAKGADLSLIEGVMGYFDGDGSGRGSCAELADILHAPVVLLLDVRASAESAAAMALGFVRYKRPSRIIGFILNRTGSPTHLVNATKAIEKATGLPVFGSLPKNTKFTLPERHLGLVSGSENSAFESAVEALADSIQEHCNVPALLSAAKVASRLPLGLPLPWKTVAPPRITEAHVRIAVARDLAFSFYYEDNFNALRDLGADLVFFSPLSDDGLPDTIDGLYLGGGYPELHAQQLSENIPMRDSIQKAISQGLPTFAECGGYMYLTEAYKTVEGELLPFVGSVPGTTLMTSGIVALGYYHACTQSSSFIPRGTSLEGHSYHWSKIEGADSARAALMLTKLGKEDQLDGFCSASLFASYLHIHFAGQPDFAQAFVKACFKYKEETQQGVTYGR